MMDDKMKALRLSTKPVVLLILAILLLSPTPKACAGGLDQERNSDKHPRSFDSFLKRLGKGRGSFGYPTDLPKGHEYAYNYHDSFSEPVTIMDFPAGRSDERYFLNLISPSGWNSVKEGQHFPQTLAFEKHMHGVATPQWVLSLEHKVVNPKEWPVLFKKLGTIERKLARANLYVHYPATRKVFNQLKIVGGLARYEGDNLARAWMCSFIDENGVESVKHKQQFVVKDGVYADPPRVFDITPEEREALKKRWTRK